MSGWGRCTCRCWRDGALSIRLGKHMNEVDDTGATSKSPSASPSSSPESSSSMLLSSSSGAGRKGGCWVAVSAGVGGRGQRRRRQTFLFGPSQYLKPYHGGRKIGFRHQKS